MAIGLERILDITIPYAVAIFVAWILYYPFREPIGKLWDKIKSWKEGYSNDDYEETFVKSITYE